MTDQKATLLHNMGCRPGVPVLHRAAHACSLVSFGLPAFGSTKQGSMKRGSTRPGILEQWCNLLGVVSTSVDARLEAILTIAQESSTSLERLPSVASVVVAGSSMRVFGLSDDPRLAIQVLSRCSNKVFIRGKSPVVSLETLSRYIALVVVDPKTSAAPIHTQDEVDE